jgi:hypothetical protein
MQVHVTAGHWNVWGYRNTWPYILTTTCLSCGILGYRKAFDTTWQPGLIYKLSKLQFSTTFIKLISSSVSQRNFTVSVEGEMSTPKYMQAGVPQGSVLSITLYNLYINDTHQTPGVNLALFADDTCLYATDRKQGYVLRKIQRVLNSMATRCEPWNIKINEDKTRAIYFTRRNRPPDILLKFNGRNISFVNSVKCLGVLFDTHGDYPYRGPMPRPLEHSLEYVPHSKRSIKSKH